MVSKIFPQGWLKKIFKQQHNRVTIVDFVSASKYSILPTIAGIQTNLQEGFNKVFNAKTKNMLLIYSVACFQSN